MVPCWLSHLRENWRPSFPRDFRVQYGVPTVGASYFMLDNEVLSILKPGSQFITQQIGGANDNDLNALLGAGEYRYAYWTLKYAVKQLQDAGWHIVDNSMLHCKQASLTIQIDFQEPMQ